MDLNEILKNLEIEKEITSTEEKDSIKKCFSSWADSIPHHGIANFGEQLELLTVKSIPSYSVMLQVQYEIRSILEGVQPYEGQSVFSQHIQLNNEREIWQINLPLIESFQNGVKEYGISEKVSACGICGGHGQVYCPDCNGRGEYNCPTCGGTHRIKCSWCQGSGRVKCNKCYGSGTVKSDYNRDITCPACGGQRYIFCSSCAGSGSTECSRCTNGKITCSRCSGNGLLTCGTCRGTGQLVTFTYLKDEFMPTDVTEVTHNNSLPKEAHSNVESEEKNAEIVTEILEKEISPDIFNSTNHKGVKDLCINLLMRGTSTAVSTSKNSRYCRIIKERICLKKIKVQFIEYKFSEKTYNAWLYGDSKVFAQTSPISEACENLFNKAQEEFNKKEYSRAFDLMEKVGEMFDRVEYKKFREKVRKVIHREYLKGAILGGTICPVIGNILGVMIGLIFKNVYSTSIRTSKGRFASAFWTSFMVNAILIIGLFLILLLVR